MDFPSPPPADSAEQKVDIAAVLDWQAKRTAADCDAASVTADATYDHLWGGRSPFAESAAAEINAFFERVASDLDEATYVMKSRYKRTRPYDAYAEAKPCIRKSRSPSYPSAHSLFARVFADVLGEILPERKDEFLKMADQTALNRVIGGVHYPTDIEAGKLFGDQFHSQLQKSPAYLQDIEKLKTFLVK